ncbi:amidohydrolase family protein [Acidaminobacter hydrogenoformans]|uniref:5-methylthioadenosine/S-adenosylhomocysteine deaminase n=1 Tax=Acidaminobacter hydrogenoformans DSM 2784 TaxID=1120920 RepID=A0A1G5S107_9FIRM|nr:amidohydrolase [Acidaminobacter hydrogenoformans]SCZ80062.1 5-methylthioadenosine/S-adenosylhomocysteine deaminase [Acidaminobacter hydrogenoformans DSM 2784]
MEKKYDLIIRGGMVLNEHLEICKNHSIVIKNNLIVEVAPEEQIDSSEGKEIIEGKDKLWMPGLVDAHTHITQQLLRGKILDELPMIWTRIMLPYENGLTKEMAELSAQLASLEMIKSGTTSFVEAGGRHMEAIAAQILESGLRGALTCSTIDSEVMPSNMTHSAKEAISQNMALYENYHGAGDGQLSVHFSIRSILSCSEDLIRLASEAALEADTKLHMHMNEYPNEVNFSLEHHGKRPFQYLDDLGVLQQNFHAAHCILTSDEEIDMIRERGVSVVHCPFSNSGKGVPQTPRLLQQKVPVALGTDGAAHGGLSLWNEMKIMRSVINAHIGSTQSNPVILPAKSILKMATTGGAAALGMVDRLGTIGKGKVADLISIDLNQPHIMPTNNLAHTLLETVCANDVADMVVNGKVIMRNRKVLTLDEEKIMYMASKAATVD